MKPYEAAKIKPLVVIFCWERFEALSMALPRVVNATRKVGGYLWAIDDASKDDRIPRMLKDWHEKGFIDWITLGKINRHVDWMDNRGMISRLARRSIIMHWLHKHKAPVAILVEADMVIGPNVFEDLLEANVLAHRNNIPYSSLCGFHYNLTIFSCAPERLGRFEIRKFGRNMSQPVVLITYKALQFVEKNKLSKEPQRWSLNHYAVNASEVGLHAVFVMNLPTQHLGVGIVGSGIRTQAIWEPRGWTDKSGTTLVQVPGFDLAEFDRVAKTTFPPVQNFARKDAQGQQIIEKQEVSKWFTEYVKETA